jgi:DNA-binding CsgD family transcriptional regulator
LIEHHLRGLLTAISDGIWLEGFAQALLLGPLLETKALAVMVVAVNPGPKLSVLGSASFQNAGEHISSEGVQLDDFFSRIVLAVSGGDRFNRPGDELPTDHRFGATHYSVIPVRDHSIPKGFLLIAHQGQWHGRQFTEEFSQALEALTLHAMEIALRSPGRANKMHNSESSLTERQVLILTKMCAGLTNYQIGHQINVSESTVKQESIRIFRFLNVNKRKDAVEQALRKGLIKRPEVFVNESNEFKTFS